MGEGQKRYERTKVKGIVNSAHHLNIYQQPLRNHSLQNKLEEGRKMAVPVLMVVLQQCYIIIM